MTEQHRATPKQWLTISLDGRTNNFAAASTILELRDRIEALENAQPAKPNHPAKPDSSLKEQIKARMIQTDGSTWEATASSVLVEVAAWLREHYGGPTATSELLEQEAER